MLNDFLTMLAGGAFAALTIYALRHALRKWAGIEMAKWVMPACAGAAMLAVTIWQEYNWYPTMCAGLHEGVEVVLTGEESSWWRPWTYLVPITTRLMAMDTNRLKRHGDVVEGELLLAQRWQLGVKAVPVAYDCAAHARADLLDGAVISEEGQLVGGNWLPIDPQDRGLNVACNGG